MTHRLICGDTTIQGDMSTYLQRHKHYKYLTGVTTETKEFKQVIVTVEENRTSAYSEFSMIITGTSSHSYLKP